MLGMKEALPNLRTIVQPRHPGISEAVCASYAEAAEVCLARHHGPPRTELKIHCCGSTAARVLEWKQPDDVAIRAWNNRDDATRDGAYIVSIAAVEAELGVVALSRAETRSGADYYVGEPGSTDLEEAFRLEVSGLDAGKESDLRSRLRKKEKQVVAGNSPLPAYASVVGFREAMVLVSLIESS
jgi:hypothetical protein